MIDYLLELKWWDWPVEKVEANIKALSGGDLSLIKNIRTCFEMIQFIFYEYY